MRSRTGLRRPIVGSLHNNSSSMHSSLLSAQAQGFTRFQSRLRPSNLCQCTTSSSARSAQHTSSRRAVAVAVHSSSAGSSEPELDSPVQADPPSQQQQQQQQRQSRNPRTRARQRWDYKYKWQACPSLCSPGDERCFKVEALIQNVLSYPNMPPKVCRHLPNISADLDSMTALLEAMSAHFGKELTLLYINKYPTILELDFSTLSQRVKAFRELCGVLESDVPMLLRKFPGLVTLDPQEMRTRYDNLRDLTRFNNQEVRR